MENRKFAIFLIISLIIHAVTFYVIKLEKVTPKKQKDLTVVDLIDKKKDKIKKAKEKPKSKILANKNINLKKKSEKKKEKRPETTKQAVVPPSPTIKKQEKTKEKPKPIKQKGLSKKKEKTVEKKKATPNKKQVKQVPTPRPPSPPKKQAPKSLADLNTKGIIKDFAEKEPNLSDTGDDYIDLQAVEFKYASYFSKFKQKIKRNWNYPRSSIMKGEQGIVVVQFSILKDGTITDIKVVRSSGYPALDREVKRVLTTIHANKLPKAFQKDRIKIKANFQYMLYGNGFRIY